MDRKNSSDGRGVFCAKDYPLNGDAMENIIRPKIEKDSDCDSSHLASAIILEADRVIGNIHALETILLPCRSAHVPAHDPERRIFPLALWDVPPLRPLHRARYQIPPGVAALFRDRPCAVGCNNGSGLFDDITPLLPQPTTDSSSLAGTGLHAVLLYFSSQASIGAGKR